MPHQLARISTPTMPVWRDSIGILGVRYFELPPLLFRPVLRAVPD